MQSSNASCRVDLVFEDTNVGATELWNEATILITLSALPPTPDKCPNLGKQSTLPPQCKRSRQADLVCYLLQSSFISSRPARTILPPTQSIQTLPLPSRPPLVFMGLRSQNGSSSHRSSPLMRTTLCTPGKLTTPGARMAPSNLGSAPSGTTLASVLLFSGTDRLADKSLTSPKQWAWM